MNYLPLIYRFSINAKRKKMHEDYSCSLCLWQMARNLFQYNFDRKKTLLIISNISTATLKPFSIYHEGDQVARWPGVYLPRILRFPRERTSDTAPGTSVHPQILSLGRLGEHWDVHRTVEVIIATLTRCGHPTPGGELTTITGNQSTN